MQMKRGGGLSGADVFGLSLSHPTIFPISPPTLAFLRSSRSTRPQLTAHSPPRAHRHWYGALFEPSKYPNHRSKRLISQTSPGHRESRLHSVLVSDPGRTQGLSLQRRTRSTLPKVLSRVGLREHYLSIPHHTISAHFGVQRGMATQVGETVEWTAEKVRKTFLEYFKEHGHKFGMSSAFKLRSGESSRDNCFTNVLPHDSYRHVAAANNSVTVDICCNSQRPS